MLLVGGAAARTRAQSEPVALTWQAPAGCSSAEDVLARVRRLTQAAQLSDRQLRVEASVVPRDAGRLHLTLMLRSGGLVGERNIDGRSCDDLAGATAVVLALLLRSAEPLDSSDLDGPDPGDGAAASSPATAFSESQSAAQAPSSAPVSNQAPPAASLRAAQPERTSSPRRWHGIVQVPLVALGVGPFPRPSAGFSLAAGASFERWSLLAEASYWLEQALKSREQPAAGAKAQRVEAALRSCRAIPFGQFELAPCLRASVQHVWARGTGLHVASQTAQVTWFAAGVGVQARYHIVPWFSVFGGVDAQVETARPRLFINGVGSLGQLWPAAFTITLGSEWIL